MSNITAFEMTIRKSEGTDAPDGYSYLFTSSPKNKLRFTDFSTHPNKPITANGITSTAAGAYQILYGTWLYLSKKLNLHDFSPATQDAMAVELLKEKGAYNFIISGNLLGAVNKANSTWASLPGSHYGQPVHTYQQIKQWFLAAGGTCASV